MADPTVPSAKVYLEKSAVGGQTKLLINVTKIEEDISNNLIKIPFPQVSETNQNANTPTTKYKDLKRLTHIYTVEGYIVAQQSTSSTGEFYDSNIKVKGANAALTAPEAKNALEYFILFPYGDINFYWRGLPKTTATPASTLAALMEVVDTNRVATVAFDKIKFTDAPGLRAEHKYVGTLSGGLFFSGNARTPSDFEWNTKQYNFTLTLTKAVGFT